MTSAVPVRWLTRAEVMRYLRIGRKRFQQLRRAVPPHKSPIFGLRWDREEIDAYLASSPLERAPERPRAHGTRVAPRYAGMTSEEILSRSGYGGKS